MSYSNNEATNSAPEVARVPFRTRAKRLGVLATALLATSPMVAGCMGTKASKPYNPDTTFCAGELNRSTVNSRSDVSDTGELTVDARCTPYQDGELMPIRSGAEFKDGVIALVGHGIVLKTICYDSGQTVTNNADETSGRWIRVDLAQNDGVQWVDPRDTTVTTGYIPDIWTAGGNGVEQPCDFYEASPSPTPN